MSSTSKLGINHQSPLIHWVTLQGVQDGAGNQSPIPFDTLWPYKDALDKRWESITNPL